MIKNRLHFIHFFEIMKTFTVFAVVEIYENRPVLQLLIRMKLSLRKFVNIKYHVQTVNAFIVLLSVNQVEKNVYLIFFLNLYELQYNTIS